MDNHYYCQPLSNQDFIRYMLNCHHLHEHKSDIGKRFLHVDSNQDEWDHLDLDNVDFNALLNPSMAMLKPMHTKLPRQRINKKMQGDGCKRKRNATNSHQPHHTYKDDSQYAINMADDLRPSVGESPRRLSGYSSAENELNHHLSKIPLSRHDDDVSNIRIDTNDRHQADQHQVSTSQAQVDAPNGITANCSGMNHEWSCPNDDSISDTTKKDSNSEKESIQLNSLTAFKNCNHQSYHNSKTFQSKWTLFISKQGWMPLISDIDWISDQYMAYCLFALLYGHQEFDTFYIDSTKLIGFVSLVDLSLKMMPNQTNQPQNMPLIKFLQDQDNISQNQPVALSITSPGFGIQLPDHLKYTIMQACQSCTFPSWYSRVVYIDAFSKLDNGTPKMQVFDLSHHQAKVANFQLETSNRL